MARNRPQQRLFDFTAKPEDPQEGTPNDHDGPGPAVGPQDDDIFAGPLFRHARQAKALAEHSEGEPVAAIPPAELPAPSHVARELARRQTPASRPAERAPIHVATGEKS